MNFEFPFSTQLFIIIAKIINFFFSALNLGSPSPIFHDETRARRFFLCIRSSAVIMIKENKLRVLRRLFDRTQKRWQLWLCDDDARCMFVACVIRYCPWYPRYRESSLNRVVGRYKNQFNLKINAHITRFPSPSHYLARWLATQASPPPLFHITHHFSSLLYVASTYEIIKRRKDEQNIHKKYLFINNFRVSF